MHDNRAAISVRRREFRFGFRDARHVPSDTVSRSPLGAGHVGRPALLQPAPSGCHVEGAGDHRAMIQSAGLAQRVGHNHGNQVLPVLREREQRRQHRRSQ